MSYMDPRPEGLNTQPAPPSVVETLACEPVPTKRQAGIMQHALGIRVRGDKSYRNHFVAGPGHHDYSDLMALVRAGMMREHPASQITGGDPWFQVTDSGWTAAFDALPEPPKRTKYDEFLAYDGCITFAEFLDIRVPEYEQDLVWISPSVDRRGRYETRYRMFRRAKWHEFRQRDMQGEWKPTKQEAKASYKAALKASKENHNA
ncbi:hypothetical protein [Pandoraea sputorum]|uniref:Uncharacterized protein n=1 Tax=Pandoraea sputorum TaxID=93222 RepID=A0A5E5BFK1_9BURK|nr:hypothetical protein [Pandoraea sputorum]VVE84941.1 hypothetical protein PSP31121_05005 [Pandoraea sputorum]